MHIGFECSESEAYESKISTARTAGETGFANVPLSSGRALYRHVGESRMFGLSYDVRAADNGWYTLSIESWTYGVQGESLSVPVMDFLFLPEAGEESGAHVRRLKIMSRPVVGDSHTDARALSVALFFINQVNAGQVPNCDRILRLHGLYPVSARSLNRGV